MKITKQRAWVWINHKTRTFTLTFHVHAPEGTFQITAGCFLTRSAFLKRFVEATGRLPYGVPKGADAFERWAQVLLEQAETLPDDPGEYGHPEAA